MNKDRIATQRLADIKALITYIKEEIGGLTSQASSEQLDSMGNATITILSTLQDIQKDLVLSEEHIVQAHMDFSQKSYEQLKQPLEDVYQAISNGEAIQKENVNAIENAYSLYVEAIDQAQQTIDKYQKKSIDKQEKVHAEVTELGNTLERINSKVPKKEDYQSSLEDIQNTIQQLVEAEQAKVNQNEENLQTIHAELELSQELLMDTNKQLDNIHMTYEESTARLSVIHAKIDTITDLFMRNQQLLGGRENDRQ